MFKILSLTNLTLLVALSLSTVAAYYSIIGLTAIFAGAVIPIIIMGSILEIGKITTTVWLRKYWKRCGWLLKLYLVPAVVLLALLTSMGIFGFLSKAHMDQGLITGDSQAKLALYDEKIKTQRDNIELARKALAQMDAQVDQRLSRSDSEQAAERAVAIRRQQASERAKLQKEIGDAQKEIAKLNEERAPIAAETRKIEAEVGPIKYIAALIYGDTTDYNTLESAVRWVIILLVIVFDPLAIALVLAANASKDWDKKEEIPAEQSKTDLDSVNTFVEQAAGDLLKEIEESEKEPEVKIEEPKVEKIIDQHPYLNKKFVHFSNMKPLVASIEEYKKDNAQPIVEKEPTIDSEITADSETKILTAGVDNIERPGDYLDTTDKILTQGVTKLVEDKGEYAIYEGKSIRKDALKELHPELFKLTADSGKKSNSNFGTKFPEIAYKGDMFVRVDVLPNRVYKFDGKRWIEVNKEITDTYLHDREYIKHLVSMIENGQYDVELLSENEQREIENYIRDQKS